MQFVSLAAFEKNPDDMYSDLYYTVCVMDTETQDTASKVYRSSDGSKMRQLAEQMARDRGLELVDETF